MTPADKLRAIWQRIEAEEEDGEWLWLCWYRLKWLEAQCGQ